MAKRRTIGVRVSSIGIKWFLVRLMALVQIGARVSRRERWRGGGKKGEGQIQQKINPGQWNTEKCFYTFTAFN